MSRKIIWGIINYKNMPKKMKKQARQAVKMSMVSRGKKNPKKKAKRYLKKTY